jgi:hypothetical protein
MRIESESILRSIGPRKSQTGRLGTSNLATHQLEHFLQQNFIRVQVQVPARAHMDPNMGTLRGRKAVDHPVVELDEKVEKAVAA